MSNAFSAMRLFRVLMFLFLWRWIVRLVLLFRWERDRLFMFRGRFRLFMFRGSIRLLLLFRWASVRLLLLFRRTSVQLLLLFRWQESGCYCCWLRWLKEEDIISIISLHISSVVLEGCLDTGSHERELLAGNMFVQHLLWPHPFLKK